MNKEELDLLEIVFTLAIGECAYNDINNIQKLEDKIKTIGNLCKKQKEVIDKIKKAIKGDIDGFMTINEHGESEAILELLEIYLEILEDKEV